MTGLQAAFSLARSSGTRRLTRACSGRITPPEMIGREDRRDGTAEAGIRPVTFVMWRIHDDLHYRALWHAHTLVNTKTGEGSAPCGVVHDSEGRNLMNQRNPLSLASKLTVAALIVAALGFAIQIVFGVEVPTIPPGLVILLVAAGLVALLPWRWVPAVGAFAGLFLFVGFFASGAVVVLLDPSRLGVLVGAWIQFLALLITVVAGIIATIQNYRRRTSIIEDQPE